MVELNITSWRDLPYTSSLDKDEYRASLGEMNRNHEGEDEAGFDLEKLPPFQYEPLSSKFQQFRLLYVGRPALLRGEGVAKTRAVPTTELRSVNLRKSPKYIAISYSWGESSNEFENIIINGCVFPVRKTAYQLLCELQDADRVVPIWFDAIYLDQGDSYDKTSQIPIMCTRDHGWRSNGRVRC